MAGRLGCPTHGPGAASYQSHPNPIPPALQWCFPVCDREDPHLHAECLYCQARWVEAKPPPKEPPKPFSGVYGRPE